MKLTLPTIPTKQTAPTVTDEKQKAKLQRALQDFEAVFVNYLLQTMRKSVQKDDEEGGGFGGEMMQEMFDYEMAKHISRSPGLGIGEKLYRQVTGESMPKNPAVPVLPKQIVAAETAKAVGLEPQLPVQQVTAMKKSTAPSRNIKEAVGKYDDIINEASLRHGVDTSLIKAVIASESAGNPRALSSANAKGLMQLIDSTASMVGVKNVWDPKQNINGGTKYLRQLLDQFDGNVKLAVASYNAGPARVERHKGVPPIPETQKYVKKVLQYVDHFTGDKE
ncbi:MAG: lytic transglycosylase domain-containing protein [Bacteroidetes bacterium]|nr:lytic transglycosylase domain-containing protein [Bacteroidota bacterium]